LDGKPGRGSLSSDAKGMAESDTDSMAEYGEGDAGKNVVWRLGPLTINFISNAHVAFLHVAFSLCASGRHSRHSETLNEFMFNDFPPVVTMLL
jgi:hypothetical protein